MKRISILLCSAAFLLLTACGGGGGSTDSGSGSTNGGASGNDAPQTVTEADSGASGAASAASGTASAAKTGGYVFTSKGTDIVIDAEAAPILEALGEPSSYYEAASCAFEGLDKYYTYGSFEVDTYPDANGVDRISAVLLKDDLVSTTEGLSIGAAYEDVIGVYGTGEEDGSSLVYEKGGMKLMFIIGGEGLVESIQYQTKALDA